MPQDENLNNYNPGVDRVWKSFVKNAEQAQNPVPNIDTQAALAGKAIIDSAEGEVRRINKARGIVTYGEGEPTAIVFNDKSTDVISFYEGVGPNNHKYIGPIGTYLLQTESGNQYILAPGEGLVISARGDVYTDIYQLPNIEFGKPWGIEGKFSTTAAKQLLSEYKIGGVVGDFHQDRQSPFVWADSVVDKVVAELEQR